METPKFSYRVTHPLAVAVVEGLELDDVWMSNNAHDLKFSVLRKVSLCRIASRR
jgi:hypothetical protein